MIVSTKPVNLDHCKRVDIGVFDDGKLVGYGRIKDIDKEIPLLTDVHVLSNRRREGIGGMIAGAARCWSQSKMRPLALGIYLDNSSGRKFWQSVGATIIGKRKGLLWMWLVSPNQLE